MDSLWNLIYSQDDDEQNNNVNDNHKNESNTASDGEVGIDNSYISNSDVLKTQKRVRFDHLKSEEATIHFEGSKPHLSRTRSKRLKLPREYTESPSIRSSSDHKYAPGLSNYYKFPQPIPTPQFSQSMLRTIWDVTFYSGDIPGASEVLPYITSVCHMNTSDYYRFLELVRIRHHHMKHLNSIPLFERLEESIHQSLGSGSHLKKQSIPKRSYLFTMYIDFLIIECEIEAMYSLIKSRVADVILSPSILSIQAIITCLRTIEFIHSYPTLLSNNIHYHPSDPLHFYLPTIADIRRNTSFFCHIILLLYMKPTKAFLRKFPSWTKESVQYKNNLKAHFSACISRYYDNFTINTFYMVYLLAQKQFIEAKRYVNKVLHHFKLDHDKCRSIEPLEIQNITAFTLKYYALQYFMYAYSLTRQRSYYHHIEKRFTRLLYYQLKELKYVQSNQCMQYFLIALLLYKLKQISLVTVIQVCCTLIENPMISINPLMYISIENLFNEYVADTTINNTSHDDTMPIKQESKKDTHTYTYKNNYPQSLQSPFHKKSSSPLTHIHPETNGIYTSLRLWNVLVTCLGPLPESIDTTAEIDKDTDLYTYLIQKSRQQNIIVRTQEPSHSHTASMSDSSFNDTDPQIDDDINVSLKEISNKNTKSLPISSKNMDESTANTSKELEFFRSTYQYWYGTIFSSFIYGDCVTYITPHEASILLQGEGMQTIASVNITTQDWLQGNDFWYNLNNHSSICTSTILKSSSVLDTSSIKIPSTSLSSTPAPTPTPIIKTSYKLNQDNINPSFSQQNTSNISYISNIHIDHNDSTPSIYDILNDEDDDEDDDEDIHPSASVTLDTDSEEDHDRRAKDKPLSIYNFHALIMHLIHLKTMISVRNGDNSPDSNNEEDSDSDSDEDSDSNFDSDGTDQDEMNIPDRYATSIRSQKSQQHNYTYPYNMSTNKTMEILNNSDVKKWINQESILTMIMILIQGDIRSDIYISNFIYHLSPFQMKPNDTFVTRIMALIDGLNTYSNKDDDVNEIDHNSIDSRASVLADLNGTTMCQKYFPAFRTYLWPKDKFKDRMYLNTDKCPFVYMGAKHLELLTYQIIICSHLKTQDNLFVIRGIQILTQHALYDSLIPLTNEKESLSAYGKDKIHSSYEREAVLKRTQEFQLNTSKITYAHICLHILKLYNINITRAIYLAVHCAINHVSVVESVPTTYTCTDNTMDTHIHNKDINVCTSDISHTSDSIYMPV